jgi:hypothetical protein
LKLNSFRVKTSSSLWLKQTGKFPTFEGSDDGYAALTYAWKDKDMIVDYIKNQQEPHKKETFESELRRLLREHGILTTLKNMILWSSHRSTHGPITVPWLIQDGQVTKETKHSLKGVQ